MQGRSMENEVSSLSVVHELHCFHTDYAVFPSGKKNKIKKFVVDIHYSYILVTFAHVTFKFILVRYENASIIKHAYCESLATQGYVHFHSKLYHSKCIDVCLFIYQLKECL
jgi:hypothetical protein